MAQPLFNTVWYKYKPGSMPYNTEGVSEILGDIPASDIRFIAMVMTDRGELQVYNAVWDFGSCSLVHYVSGNCLEFAVEPLYWSYFIQDGIGTKHVGY